MGIYFLLTIFCSIGCLTEGRIKTVRNCGVSVDQQGRIVGGAPADHGEYPWMAALEIYDYAVICGAAIINEHWLVTAAHCFDYPESPEDYAIYVGSHMQKNNIEYEPTRHEISDIIIHEDYDEEMFYNDIALIRTKHPINIKRSRGLVNGICLPIKGQEPRGTVVVTGWGDTEYNGTGTDILHEVEVSIVPRRKCMKAYRRQMTDEVKGLICAAADDKDSCQGDSGGPLIQKNSSGVYTLVGIVSIGVECASKTYPGIYTKVSSYIDWLEENMC